MSNRSSSSGSHARFRDVVEQRARGVRRVRQVLARELEDQPRVDRPEHGATVSRALAQAVDVIEQPLHLRRREVWVEHQPRALAHERFVSLLAQLRAARGGAAVLPDDRVVQRLAALRVPHADRLALVRDPERRQVARAHARVEQRLARDGRGHIPDLTRIVLDPARPRKVLGELAVGAADRLGALVEDEAQRSSRALVDREDHRRANPSRASFARDVPRRSPNGPRAAYTRAKSTN